MMTIEKIGSAIAKIILLGEHSVVYGMPAIAIPLNEFKINTKIEYVKGDIEIISDVYNGYLKDVPEIIHPIKKIVNMILDEFKIEKKNLKFTVWGNIPYGRGMGSSAALSTSIVRAMYDFFDKDLDMQTCLNWVNISEDGVHGNSSGLDANVVVKGKPIYYIKNESFEELNMNLEGYLLIADTGLKGKTKEAVSGVKKLLEENPAYMKDIYKLGDLAREAKICIQNNLLEKLGLLMDQAHDRLKNLEVSCPELDNLVEISRQSGALGAKLTGGGRGGCMIALFPDMEACSMVSNRLFEEGASNIWIAYLGKLER